MERRLNDSVLQLVQGDITQETTDVIVNAANNNLVHDGGVAAAIAKAAGSRLVRESDGIDYVPTGSIAVTTAGNLSAKYVFHAVGPVWEGGDSNEAELLSRCVRTSLDRCVELELRSISFPAISTGIYGFPLEPAAKIMLDTTLNWMDEQIASLTIRFVLFSPTDLGVFASVLADI